MTTPCSSADNAVQQKTALIVTSGSDVDELLTSVLVSDGWSFQRAVDNQHALALATNEPFDLIITGRGTPGPEDVELLHSIGEHGWSASRVHRDSESEVCAVARISPRPPWHGGRGLRLGSAPKR